MASIKVGDRIKTDLKKECVNNLDDKPMKEVVEKLIEKFLYDDLEGGIKK